MVEEETGAHALEALELLLRSHNWNYRAMDDPKRYEIGRRSWRAISVLLEMTGDKGIEMLKNYKPEGL